MTSDDGSSARTTTTCEVTTIARGVPVEIVDVRAEDTVRRRLAQLGLRVGAELTVVRATAGGGRILAVAGARIALDRDTAQGLRVRERTT